jgi:hypothetical protein
VQWAILVSRGGSTGIWTKKLKYRKFKWWYWQKRLFSCIKKNKEIQDGGQGRESEILSSVIPETTLRHWSYT